MADFFGEQEDMSFWQDMGQGDGTAATVEAVEEPVEEAAPQEEPQAEAPVEPEAEAEPEKDDRPRDEQGRFVSRNIEIEDEDTQAFLAKYGGDPVKALKAAAEAQRHIGSLNNELGQLRPLAEKLDALEARLSQPQQVPTQITEDLIDRDPAAATALAYEQGNQQALSIAYNAWKDEDPAGAAVWVATQQMQAREQALVQRIGELESRLTPLQQSREEQAFAQEVRQLGPDAIEQIRQGAANLPPAVAQTFYSLLENGTQEQKIGALQALRELTQGRDQPATLDDVRTLAREQAIAADEAIAEAAVVSATATKSEPAGKSAADLIGDEWAAFDRQYTDGWQIGPR